MKSNSELKSRAAAAKALKVSGNKLSRMIRDGLPVERDGRIELGKARSWIAAHETPGRRSPALHPDDPRYQHKVTIAKLDRIKLARKLNVVIPVADVMARVENETTTTRSALLNVHTQIMTHDKAGVSTAIEDALANLKFDDAREWPTPRPMPTIEIEEAEDESDAWMEGPAAAPTFAVRFSEHDPRAIVHAGKAARAKAELEELESGLLDLTDVLDWARKKNGATRARIRSIPDRLDYSGDVVASLQAEVCTALNDIAGDFTR